jgi:nucleotide-binding universal stress UspA family protein
MTIRPIVCATRGGEASRRAQERAIALAREQGAPLIFLFVADTTPISMKMKPSKDLADLLADELEQLGGSLLCIAQARAHEHGVEADMAVRRGAVRPALESFLREVDAGTLVIGAPERSERNAEHPPVFDPAGMDHFAAQIRADLGVEVVVVE